MNASKFTVAQEAFILKQGNDGVWGVYLPQRGEQPAGLLQLEEKARWFAAT